MNHSIYGADRTTHLKIVGVGLFSALMVAAVGSFAHFDQVNPVKRPAEAGQAALFNGRGADARQRSEQGFTRP